MSGNGCLRFLFTLSFLARAAWGACSPWFYADNQFFDLRDLSGLIITAEGNGFSYDISICRPLESSACNDVDTSVCRETADQTDPTVLARWEDSDPVYSLLDPSNANAGVRMVLQNGDECFVENSTSSRYTTVFLFNCVPDSKDVPLTMFVQQSDDGCNITFNHFSYLNCPLDSNQCASSPCYNQGTCSNDGDGYQCTCPSQFEGTNCELAQPCVSNPCQNGGTCTNVDTSTFSCGCTDGYTGAQCETSTTQEVQQVDRGWFLASVFFIAVFAMEFAFATWYVCRNEAEVAPGTAGYLDPSESFRDDFYQNESISFTATRGRRDRNDSEDGSLARYI